MHQLRRVVFFLILLGLALPAGAQSSEFASGDSIQLVERDKHIPGHPGVGVSAVNLRFASGTNAEVISRGSGNQSHWYEIRGETTQGPTADAWIIAKYIEARTGEQAVPSGIAQDFTVIGSWNLEHFSHSKSRGFPENTRGGPSFPARTQAQLAGIARVIEDDLEAGFLMLSEIDGQNEEDEVTGETAAWSHELEDLVAELGDEWMYSIAQSGGSQRVAAVWDTRRVQVLEIIEMVFPFERVDGKDVFARDPLAAHISLLERGVAANDLVVIGLHLASGQHRDDNHDRAMELLVERIESLRAAGSLGGSTEDDILITGDLNANAFRTPAEQFFIDMDEPDGFWNVLAEGGYPATRLSGNPLRPRTSQIDYIIVSRGEGDRDGLSGEEISVESATVHIELAEGAGFAEFRRDYSDHIPVTVRVSLQVDTD